MVPIIEFPPLAVHRTNHLHIPPNGVVVPIMSRTRSAALEDVVIIGAGDTEFTRDPDGPPRYPEQLNVQSAVDACDDAGLSPADLDGLVFPYQTPGLEISDVYTGLGLDQLSFSCRITVGGASVTALGAAAAAIHSGRARYVVVPTGFDAYSGENLSGDQGGDVMAGFLPNYRIRKNLEHPYGLMVPMQYYSLHANRWLHDYDIDPDSMGEVALAARRNAHTNPRAYMQGRELTREDYEDSPYLVEPLRMLDCCLETDGGSAVVLTSRERARDLKPDPVSILAVGEGRPEYPDDVIARSDMLDLGISHVAEDVFGRSGVGHDEIDFAEVYDCFTFIMMRQLEEMGFCERGESPDFIRDVGIDLEGDLPINTHGGLLSETHNVGMNGVVEAVRQLRGTRGEGQVEGAEIGLVTGYGELGDGALAVLAAD